MRMKYANETKKFFLKKGKNFEEAVKIPEGGEQYER